MGFYPIWTPFATKTKTVKIVLTTQTPKPPNPDLLPQNPGYGPQKIITRLNLLTTLFSEKPPKLILLKILIGPKTPGTRTVAQNRFWPKWPPLSKGPSTKIWFWPLNTLKSDPNVIKILILILNSPKSTFGPKLYPFVTKDTCWPVKTHTRYLLLQ
jgi:hypothetical protein